MIENGDSTTICGVSPQIAAQSTIATEKGLINRLFGAGAAFGALFAP